jgi:taurine dioxygenase
MEAATKHRDGPVALTIPEIPERARYETIAVRPLTPVIGAEIEGIDLSAGLSDAQFAEVRRALLEWKVIFFRDQDIATEQHLDFGRRFGPLEVFPFAPPKPGYPEVLAITHNEKSRGRENTWHSDVTWREIPSLGSILRAIEVPPVGGDTLFADMYMAYEGLSDEIKECIDGRVAVHDFPHIRRDFRKKGVSEAEIEAFEKTYPKVEHPVVRTHPETGRKGLYVNAAFTQSIVGIEPEESGALLKRLYAQAAIPEYQCRFRWRKNSIAFWDNRACQHYAASDYFPAVRRMERVTVVGDRPF